jgi:hypothetical protein
MVHGACCEFHVILTGWMRGGTRETQTSLYLETDGDYLFPARSLRMGDKRIDDDCSVQERTRYFYDNAVNRTLGFRAATRVSDYGFAVLRQLGPANRTSGLAV